MLFKSQKKLSLNSEFTKKENLFFAFLISRSCKFTMSCPKYLNFNFSSQELQCQRIRLF